MARSTQQPLLSLIFILRWSKKQSRDGRERPGEE
ncbi:unnamed protein product [Linum tenue]|uniref:Uncharacterized protein n=1 Tax=Linum tenue TaxID=586396 RepID=A0AAV0HBG6_9ROSI|nr:unnamed protein product [Linum tenue]